VYFAIATLAMAIVIETLVNNWSYVGGAKGYYVLTPEKHLWFDSYIQMLFMVMLLMTLAAVAISRALSSSRLGRGLAAIRDDEVAAECAGVPTLRLKLVSTTVMGAMMGVAGAPFPFFVTFVDPLSAFSLFIAVNAIAMPMIGGTAHWGGPVVGALLVGSAQEAIKVNVSSELNVLLVGIMLVVFITLAPQGIVGLAQKYWKRRRA
jgi:branched-chain amino acid transport system permease protein